MAANHLSPAWTTEEDLRLAQLIQDGLTYSAIGAEMGRTKNSCISRAHRALGIYTKDTTPRPPKKVKQQAAPKPAPKPVERLFVPRAPIVQDNKPEPLYALPEASTTPFGEPRRLLQLEARHCRFPVSGEGRHTLFCCADRDGLGPYCTEHRLVAWRPTPRQNLQKLAKAYR